MRIWATAARDRMAEDGPPASARREALMVWLKLFGLLALVFAFGAAIFALRRAL